MRAEIDMVVGARDIAAEDIDRLIFTRQVLLESMRLFPPAIGVGPMPLEDISIGPCEIRKSELVLVASWCVHRHEKLWEEPHSFDPARFATENSKARHCCAYLPFGTGPRICIEMSFVMTEMIVLLATLVRSFHFNTVPGPTRVELATNLTLRAKNGLPLSGEPL